MERFAAANSVARCDACCANRYLVDLFLERSSQKYGTVDSGFYSSTSSSLDRLPPTSLPQVPYDDNDSGHYEAVVPYEPGGLGDLEGYYENPQCVFPHAKTHRSNSETLAPRTHGVRFAKRSISYSETERFEQSDLNMQHLKRIGYQDSRAIGKTDLSAQIAANAAKVAAHFQRKDDKELMDTSDKWRPPVAKKNYFSPPTSPVSSHASPVRSTNFDKVWKQMENPRQGIDNEFLDDNYKISESVIDTSPNSFLSQIQRRRSCMKYVAKRQ